MVGYSMCVFWLRQESFCNLINKTYCYHLKEKRHLCKLNNVANQLVKDDANWSAFLYDIWFLFCALTFPFYEVWANILKEKENLFKINKKQENSPYY